MEHNHSKPLSTSQGPIFVRHCACGGVHVCIGGVSINLGREAALYLAGEFARVTAGWEDTLPPKDTAQHPPLLKLAFSNETN